MTLPTSALLEVVVPVARVVGVEVFFAVDGDEELLAREVVELVVLLGEGEVVVGPAVREAFGEVVVGYSPASDALTGMGEAEAIRVAAVLLSPVMPSSALEVRRRLGDACAPDVLRLTDAEWRTSGEKRVLNEGPLWPRKEIGVVNVSEIPKEPASGEPGAPAAPGAPARGRSARARRCSAPRPRADARVCRSGTRTCSTSWS